MNAVETLSVAEGIGIRLMAEGADLLVEAESAPPPELLDALRRDKQQILELLRDRATNSEAHSGIDTEIPNLRGLTFADLESVAGEYWPEIANDSVRIEALALAITMRQQREQGEVPANWTQVCECAGCGPVYLWPGSPNRVLGCPWCFNRAEGRPFPRQDFVVEGPGSRSGGSPLMKQKETDYG